MDRNLPYRFLRGQPLKSLIFTNVSKFIEEKSLSSFVYVLSKTQLLCIFTSWLCSNGKERFIKLTTRYACKVVDLLIKLIVFAVLRFPEYAEDHSGPYWPARRVFSCIYVLRTPVYIWNRIARCTHFILFLVILGNFWRLIFRLWAPNFGVKHETQVKNTAKYAKSTVDGKEDISQGISYHRLIKHKQALNLPMYRLFLMNVFLFLFLFLFLFFFNISLPGGGGGHCKVSTLEEFVNLWQSIKASWNNRDKQ